MSYTFPTQRKHISDPSSILKGSDFIFPEKQNIICKDLIRKETESQNAIHMPVSFLSELEQISGLTIQRLADRL